MTSPGGPSAVEQTAAGDELASAVNGAGSGVGSSSVDTASVGTDGLATVGGREAAAQRPYDVGPIWALLLPPLTALALALWNITTPSYWRDEAATMAAVKRPFGDLVSMLGNVDAVHGAYYIMMWPVAHFFGTGELVMRLPSALAAAVTAAFVAAIGRRLISPWVGLAAGLLLAILPVTARYGQEARSYGMVMGLATIASYLLMRACNAESARRRRWFVGYGAGLAALGIMNIFGLLLIPAHAVTLALRYRRLRGSQDARRLAVGWLAATVAGVVVSGPALVLGWEQRGQIAWIANTKAPSPGVALVTLTGSALVTIVIAAVIVIALFVSSEATGARRPAWHWQLTELSLPWMAVPPVLLLGASVISPIYTSRYILMCIPAVALLGGMALVMLGRVAGPVALALALLAGLTIQVTQRQPGGHGDDIRGLDRVVAAHARPGDYVLYTNPNAESFSAAYSYGLGKLPDIAIMAGANASGTLAGTSVGSAALRARLEHAKRVWVVEINHCLSEPLMQKLNAVKLGPALAGLPLTFVKIWHERADWVLLYKHGVGSQATTTACVGHT